MHTIISNIDLLLLIISRPNYVNDFSQNVDCVMTKLEKNFVSAFVMKTSGAGLELLLQKGHRSVQCKCCQVSQPTQRAIQCPHGPQNTGTHKSLDQKKVPENHKTQDNGQMTLRHGFTFDTGVLSCCLDKVQQAHWFLSFPCAKGWCRNILAITFCYRFTQAHMTVSQFPLTWHRCCLAKVHQVHWFPLLRTQPLSQSYACFTHFCLLAANSKPTESLNLVFHIFRAIF